jgi:hypothetical protein
MNLLLLEKDALQECEVAWIRRFYLTQCIYELVLDSQLPHKTVKLIFQLVKVNNKLTILWGS